MVSVPRKKLLQKFDKEKGKSDNLITKERSKNFCEVDHKIFYYSM